jgi:hypothetical protein
MAEENKTEHNPIPVTRLNPKDVVGGDLKKLVMSQKIALPCDLYTVIGRAGNLRDGTSQYGAWTALVGEFEATNVCPGSPAFGEVFISTQCFIPGAAGELLVAAVRQFVQEPIPPPADAGMSEAEWFKKHGRTYKATGEFAEMALIVSARLNEREGGAPYEFIVRPIVPVKKADSLAALRDKMNTSMLRLAAPKEEKKDSESIGAGDVGKLDDKSDSKKKK